MKKGYSRQHPGAAIVFVGKGGIAHRSMVPKPLAIDQKNLITEVKMHLIELLISIQLKIPPTPLLICMRRVSSRISNIIRIQKAYMMLFVISLHQIPTHSFFHLQKIIFVI